MISAREVTSSPSSRIRIEAGSTPEPSSRNPAESSGGPSTVESGTGRGSTRAGGVVSSSETGEIRAFIRSSTEILSSFPASYWAAISASERARP